MSQVTSKTVNNPVAADQNDVVSFPQEAPRSVLDAIVRQGAQQMLQAAIEQEVADFLSEHQHLRDEQGRRLVVRNGSLPSREVQTGAGPLEVTQPRVRDKNPDCATILEKGG